MKGYRFYLQYDGPANKRKGTHQGNVVAVELDGGRPLYTPTGNMEAIVAVYDWPNCAVTGSSVSPDYLRDNCKRIMESRARQIHPRLFHRLSEGE